MPGHGVIPIRTQAGNPYPLTLRSDLDPIDDYCNEHGNIRGPNIP